MAISGINFLTRPLRYSNGGDVFTPNVAPEDLGVLENSSTPLTILLPYPITLPDGAEDESPDPVVDLKGVMSLKVVPSSI